MSSLCDFKHLGYFRLIIHKYTHLPSPDSISNRVCRWPDRVFSLQLEAVTLFPGSNRQTHSHAIARHCLCHGLPLGLSSLLSGALSSQDISFFLSIKMLTCHRPTLSLTGFDVGAIESSRCNFTQLDLLPIASPSNILICHHPTLSLTGFAVGSIYSFLCNSRVLDLFPLSNQ